MKVVETKSFIGSRGEGKTTKLLEEFNKSNTSYTKPDELIVWVSHNQHEAFRVKHVFIENFICNSKRTSLFLRARGSSIFTTPKGLATDLRGSGYKIKALFIDNIDLCDDSSRIIQTCDVLNKGVQFNIYTSETPYT